MRERTAYLHPDLGQFCKKSTKDTEARYAKKPVETDCYALLGKSYSSKTVQRPSCFTTKNMKTRKLPKYIPIIGNIRAYRGHKTGKKGRKQCIDLSRNSSRYADSILL